MRILHGVLSGSMAGGQKVCLDLMRNQVKQGHEVLLSSPSNGLMISLCPRQVAVSYHSVDKLTRPWVLFKLVVFLRSTRPDLIHTHVAVSGNILWRVAGWLTGIPVINHVHINNYYRPDSLSGKIALWIDNFTSHFTARFIAVSQQIAEELKKQGYAVERITAIPNGVLFEENIESRAKDDREAPVVGCVARLCQTKDQATLLKAFSEIHSQFSTAQLWLIGEDQETGGSYREYLEQLAIDLKVVDYVRFMGHRTDAQDLMMKMELLVLPSWDEGLPLVLLEAMAQGTPVVATSVGGVAELVSDGVDGILIKPGDETALAAAITEILGNTERARKMGEVGREKIKQGFTLKRSLCAVDQVYQEVLAEA